MDLEFGFGNNAIRSYRRLAYTPWHAIAEFVDNSTQAYFNNREALDRAFEEEGEGLVVSVVYDADNQLLRVTDNSIGMSLVELERALQVGVPPENATGRSRYGMGMKTAACWIGNTWSVETKKLGENLAYTVRIDVEKIAEGQTAIPVQASERDPKVHYTRIEVRDHNRAFRGRTLGKIREFLGSMYRLDFRNNSMRLEWQGDALAWDELDRRLLQDRSGNLYKRPFDFCVNGKRVHGWAGVLGSGSRAHAGFSILHAGRVVKGYPESWRPEKIFGAGGGRNDLINQRLVGEIHLDEFEVSHTKDDILWYNDEQDLVEAALEEEIKDYIAAARQTKRDREASGPSEAEIDAALDVLKDELMSDEMIDQVDIKLVPMPEEIRRVRTELAAEIIAASSPSFTATIGELLTVAVFVDADMSPNDPYVLQESAVFDTLSVIINQRHPHFLHIEGSEGLANYFRHCIYDAIAEWQASRRVGSIDSDTVKTLKDQLLRVAMQIEDRDRPESQVD